METRTVSITSDELNKVQPDGIADELKDLQKKQKDELAISLFHTLGTLREVKLAGQKKDEAIKVKDSVIADLNKELEVVKNKLKETQSELRDFQEQFDKSRKEKKSIKE